ncbi:hyaluronan mediated motility receptor-like [Hylaeus anthracinus]|uniref:hyaluronan mediated motility receptor-like n=1 Tax=Hylaeus anthracinus TaxID=313031 RepID=UPI0023B90443|nr:hyaluronan mediated motility receptor-like [Hylaeus anthracinus]
MSFSKARIQRFNEFENEVPPPGAYDPKFDVKVKGIVIEKSDRFHDNKSVVSAEHDLSVSAKSRSNVVASFRTPQLPRKKVSPRSCSKAKPRALIPTSTKKLKYKPEHQLADLQVECTNKNKTIQEHEKLIEDMKTESRMLELQLEELRRKQADTEDQHRKDIETMAKLQQDVLNGHVEKHQLEIEHLRCQLLEVSDEKEREIQARKAVEEDLRNRIAGFTQRIVELEAELVDEKRANEEKIQALEAQIEELLKKLQDLTERHKCEVSLLEQDKSELNSFINHLTDEIAECEERMKKTIAESDEKVNAIKEAKATVEEEMRLTVERYKASLARVEMERTALDEKLAQKDAEINRLSAILEELKSSAETQESFSQSLQMELDRAETELAGKKEELRALKDQIRSEAAEMVARRKRFEVIMAENQASVAALTKRLAQSNAEIERLQRELKRGEDCINEHRDLLSIMHNNSQMVHVQVHTLMEQLDANKGLVNQLEAESLSEVESIRTIFEAKIEDLKQIVTNEVTKLKDDCDIKDADNAEMKKQLHEMADHLNEAQSVLLKMEERYDAQELEISRVELLNVKLNDQLKASKEALEETTKFFETQSANHKIALSEANAKIQELSDKIKSLEEKDNIIQDKTKSLEYERASREAAEEKIKNLLEHNERLAKDYQEISEKYAELLGHQNHKQRIKHVSQLKDKINQLEQDLRVKIRITEQQQKIIEKLKAEEKRTHSKGKENMLGIPKSAHATPVSSPHKSLTPLRDRND